MPNIRDEIGKLLDIRIPPNGYRRYIKEVGRTGGFQDTQRDDCIIVLCQAVEELQKEVVELRQHPNINPFGGAVLGAGGAPSVLPKPNDTEPKFKCLYCGRGFDVKIGLLGHSRTHKKDATITQRPGSNSDKLV